MKFDDETFIWFDRSLNFYKRLTSNDNERNLKLKEIRT